jgi:hypothetical protein
MLMGFLACSSCRHRWGDRQQFLGDPDVALVGYQVNFGELGAGHLLFNHLAQRCRSTISVRADKFSDLYEGPIFEERATGSNRCPGHCLRETVLDPCPGKCECAYVREVLQIVSEWPKHGKAGTPYRG